MKPFSLHKPARWSFVNTYTMKQTILPLLAVFSLLAPALLPTKASAQDVIKDGQPRYVQTRLVPEFAAVKPGQTLSVAIDQQITEHWHVYWKNPGDSGEALNAKWTLPAGFAAGDIQWPIPSRIPVGPLLNYGYSTHNTLLTDITVPDKVDGSEVTLTANLEWLVCEEICVPETTTLTMTLPVAPADAEIPATDEALFTAARAAMAQPVDWPGMVEEQNGALLLNFNLPTKVAADLTGARDITFFPDEWGVILNASVQENSIQNETLKIKLARDTRALQELGGQITGTVSYADADGIQHGVKVQVPVPASAAVVEQLAHDTMAKESGAQESGTSSTPAATPTASKITLWQALGLALLGGLVLNLMPCVFPVLSMKALSLVKMSEREQSHAVTHGLMYTCGILISFSLIAALLITLQQAGNQIGWGFQLQNPTVVLLLAYLLFLMGLNLSGMFEIGSSSVTNLGSKLSQKQGYAGSFFTGMLATIVATPCTAPFMGAAMGYAVTQTPVVALSVFCALGLGLALPYLLLTIIPALRRALPRPGSWMETFRQFLAFPMYASTAWLIWVYGQQIDGAYGGLLAGFGIVFIAMGVWLWKNAPVRNPGKLLVKAFSLAMYALAVAIAVFSMMKAPHSTGTTTAMSSADQGTGIQHSGDWHPFTQLTLDDALKGNDPVFVNMTASWCITCKVNEKVALSGDATQKVFKDNKVLYLIGDWTNENPEITAYLSSYDRTGVPLYVYYGSRDLTTNTRPDPVVLPQLLTPGLIADTITYN